MKLILLTLFCFYGFMLSTVEGIGSEIRKVRLCVSLTSRPLPVNRVKSYTIEEGPMRAVIFVTYKGLKICADPEANWAKNIIKHVDSKRRKNWIQTTVSQPPQERKYRTQPTGSQPPTERTSTITMTKCRKPSDI